MTSPPPQAPDLPALDLSMFDGPIERRKEAIKAYGLACYALAQEEIERLTVELMQAQVDATRARAWHELAEKAERELSALRRVWEDAKKFHAEETKQLHQEAIQVGAENNELRAQLGAAQKDAERYRWLRRFESGAHPVWLRMCEIDFCDEEMDAAIDAAREEKSE